MFELVWVCSGTSWKSYELTMVRVCKFWYELTVVRVDYNRNYSAILATLLIFYLQGSENGRIVTIELTSYRHILMCPHSSQLRLIPYLHWGSEADSSEVCRLHVSGVGDHLQIRHLFVSFPCFIPLLYKLLYSWRHLSYWFRRNPDWLYWFKGFIDINNLFFVLKNWIWTGKYKSIFTRTNLLYDQVHIPKIFESKCLLGWSATKTSIFFIIDYF